jgi:phosphatidylserine/phosphatidylglycerophosphate/cardiolipin synthase-like enzyme
MPKRSTKSRRKPRWNLRTIIVVCVIALAVALYLADEQQAGVSPTPTPTPSQGQTAVSSGLIKVFFTTPSLVYPDRRQLRQPSPLLDGVLSDIADAEQSIDVASFDFDVLELSDALAQARQRGVAVRVIIDRENLDSAQTAAAVGRLEDARVPVTFDDREAFMHDKFIVVDRRIVWTGSWNLTYNDTFRNNNNAVRMRSQLAADTYAAEFEQMFNGTFGPSKASIAPHARLTLDGSPIDIYFSPEDGVAEHVLAEIRGARESIHVLAFSFTSKDITSALIEQARDGVQVQGVMERQNAGGVGATFGQLERAGLDVLEDGNCYILHHKTMIIDGHIVITGSYNFTNSAEKSNDENLIIVNDREVAQLYQAEFERIYSQAQSPTRCG